MKQKTIMSTLALMAIFALAACSSDELPTDPSFDQDIKTELVDKSQFPEWLADYIDYLEYVPDGQDLPTEPSGIYRFEWDGKTFYEISSPSQSTLHEEMYTADGVRYRLQLNEQKAFSDGVRNWTIVYIFKPTHEKPKNHEYPVNTDDTEIEQFFKRVFPSKVINDGIDFNKEQQDEMKFYLVNSSSQLNAIYTGNDSLPAIDFNQYSLIIGTTRVPEASTLERQEVTTDSDTPTLRLFFEKKLSNRQKAGDSNSLHFFWALYPKMATGKLEVEQLVNHQPSEIPNLLVAQAPEEKTSSSVVWEVRLPMTEFVSETDFNKSALGYGWAITEIHNIHDDGTIDDYNHWGHIGGWSIMGYEFEKGVTTTFRQGLVSDLYGKFHQQQTMRYSEKNSQIFMNSVATLQLVSIHEEQMEVVLRLPAYQSGILRGSFYYLVFKRLSNQELKDMKTEYKINIEDVGREMTKEDLWHRWYLSNVKRTDGHDSPPIEPEDFTKMMSIQFLPDGNIEVVRYNNGKVYMYLKATYEFDGKEEIIISADKDWVYTYPLSRIFYSDIKGNIYPDPKEISGKVRIYECAWKLTIWIGYTQFDFNRGIDE